MMVMVSRRKYWRLAVKEKKSLYKPPSFHRTHQIPQGRSYFADLRMTFRQNFIFQDWFRNKQLGVGLVLG
jgi:hypothetical protein